MNQSSNQSCKLHLQTRNGSTNYCTSTILPVPGFSVDYRSGKYFTDGYVNVKTERFRLWFISWFSVTNGKYPYHGLCDKKKKKKKRHKKREKKSTRLIFLVLLIDFPGFGWFQQFWNLQIYNVRIEMHAAPDLGYWCYLVKLLIILIGYLYYYNANLVVYKLDHCHHAVFTLICAILLHLYL